MQFNSYIYSISNDNIHDDKKLLLLCFFINEEVWKLTEKEFQIDLQALLIFQKQTPLQNSTKLENIYTLKCKYMGKNRSVPQQSETKQSTYEVVQLVPQDFYCISNPISATVELSHEHY